MKLKFLGHSCFLITINGVKILTDPFISNNPNISINPLEIKPDVILVTHDHKDHLGDTIDIAKSCGASVITIFDLAEFLSKYAVCVLGGNIGGTIIYKDISFTFVKADHSSNKGVAIGFVITFGDESIYFAGDTGVFYDMKIIKDLYSPKISILPIDGYYNMGPREAAYACTLLESDFVIPMHFGTFPLLNKTPEMFKKELISKNIKTKMILFDILEEKEI
ncbi:MAG: metal-dependent hydrolase [Candidatus ainarchaeum sp.]|nr:metal-dependent hydrolase [Candidatus ainarchaeum sp.]MDD3975650.1 metal-dependent hydrolase [Candidatus ainarchaeum sp.]